jgi:phospholipid/cholesterol/gamma-HCH transport system substrate-binding protein
MISRLTKIQLVIFALIVAVGATFVGGRYAQLDRLVVDRTFPVTADFVDSGGIFAGAEVTYRGIAVGRVKELSFTDDGVDVVLDIEKSAPKISADVVATVANKSAIGEQYVDLSPRSNEAPYLRAGSEIPRTDTRIPIDTTTLLLNLNGFVSSIDTQNLKTVVDELGAAFEGTAPDLERILDTSSEFIAAAQDNLEVTQNLIRNSSGVLQTQIDEQPQLATFAENLALLSDTLRETDPDLRRLVDEGAPSASLVADVVDENSAELRTIFADLRSATAPLARNSNSLRALFILYPYLLEGTFSVVAPAKAADAEGQFDAAFGLVITDPVGAPPESKPCTETDNGQRERREPNELYDMQFDVNAGCIVEDRVPRGADKTVIDRDRAAVGTEANVSGKDSWKWLLLGPATR